jgi:nucleoside triphosphate diphosphatase
MSRSSALPPLERLLSIMARLRDPQNGCEWDRTQDFASIAPYTIEEAYEVADAIARADMAALKDELGDLLLQVVFHSRMAQEAGAFTFDDVAATISAKLESRHPHIFSDGDEHTNQTERWETLKSQERAAKGATGALDGIALALPALMRAEKLQKRAARAGFDWPDPDGVSAKVHEEIAELANAGNDAERIEEAGDLLFAVVNLVRHYKVAPEDALRSANAKFERRFREMERLAMANGQEFAALPLDEQEHYWQAVKESERGKAP